MYQIFVDRERLEIKIGKIKHIFRGTTPEKEATQNPTKIIKYNSCYSFCANRKLLVDYANEIKERWLINAYEDVKRIEQMKF